ncbi:MAG: hypothetical protein KA965_04915 [Butyrivibrio sp.]|nr:hypothetical protein [Butyrivibrio sp.]
MTFMEFSNQIVENLLAYAGEDNQISIREITKNNGIVLHGLLWEREKNNCSPTIYLEGFYQKYQNGMEMTNIMMELIHAFEEYTPDHMIDMSFFTEYTYAKNKILFKLINYERNRTMLADMPHIRYQDLAIVFYCRVQEVDGGMIMIHNGHMKMWQATEQDLYDHAVVNTPKLCPISISNLRSTVEEMMGEEQAGDSKGTDTEDEMQVLTNQSKLFGAVSILYPDVLQNIAERLHRNLYVLPSSVHEVILLPEREGEKGTEESLAEIVKDVNSTVVDTEDILADSVYYYDRARKSLSVCI